MVDKQNQAAYIEYLEDRLQKLSENTSIGNQDLNTLIDTENEIYINNSYSVKKVLNESHNLVSQLDAFQRRAEISDQYINYLSNSFWWKASFPFRFLSRQFKKLSTPPAFDFSSTKTITNPVKVIIYITKPNNQDLESQITNISEQKGLKNIQIAIIDLTNSASIAKIAQAKSIQYLNSFVTDNDIELSKILFSDSDYIVSLKDNVIPEDQTWLYKMVRPLVDGYTTTSILYPDNSAHIKSIKKETFFKELKNRIITIGNYNCLFLPSNRNNIQYIPTLILDGASATAKRREA